MYENENRQNVLTQEVIQELQRLLVDGKRVQLDYNKRDNTLKISECTPKKIKVCKLQAAKTVSKWKEVGNDA